MRIDKNGYMNALKWKEGALLISKSVSHWTNITPNEDYMFNSVAYGNNIFIAVGNGGKIAVSSNGTSWIQNNYVNPYCFYSVAYGDSQFVVVGSENILLSHIMDSSMAAKRQLDLQIQDSIKLFQDSIVNYVNNIKNESNRLLHSLNPNEINEHINAIANSNLDDSITQIEALKKYYKKLKYDIANFTIKNIIQYSLTIKKRMPGIYAITGGSIESGLQSVFDGMPMNILETDDLIKFYENIGGQNGTSSDKAILNLSKYIGRYIWLQSDATLIQSSRDYPLGGRLNFMATNYVDPTGDGKVTANFRCSSKNPVPPYRTVGIFGKILSFEKGSTIAGRPVIITNLIVNFTYSPLNSVEDGNYDGELIFND